ncbi:Rv3235 family protein [Actinokineospora sp. 24-640]
MLTALPTYEPIPVPAPRHTPCRPYPRAAPFPVGRAPVHPDLAKLLTALVEVLTQRRPAHQLAPYLTPTARTALRALPPQPPTLRLRSVHTCHLDPITVEIAATLTATRRAKALATRAHRTRDRWCLTALHIIGG